MIEFAVPSENLKLAYPIPAEDSVDNMVRSLWFLRVANLPVADLIYIKESFLYAELALILVILVLVVEKTVFSSSGWYSLHQAVFSHVGH